jgi:hypothetical protein
MAVLEPTFIEFGAGVEALLAEMQKRAEAYQHSTFDWDGNTEIPCTASQAKFGKEMNIAGGWEIRRRVKISVRIEELPDIEDLPAPNDTFILRLSPNGPEVKYRILATKNSNDTTLEIEGVDTNHPQ